MARAGRARTRTTAASKPILVSWRPRITARARITMVFTGLLLACGLTMLAILYLVMRYIPTYSLQAAVFDPNAAAEQGGITNSPAIPTPGTGTDSAPAREATGMVQQSVVVQSADDIFGVLLTSSAAVLLVMVVLGAVASWIVAGRLLRPVHGLTVAARIASSGSLDHRIGLSGPPDEFTELSDTFDEMLERLQRSFGAYERFAANASHELQTPLTTAKAVLELARNQPDLDVDRLIDRLERSNERSIRTVSALLDLAESSHGELALEPVDLRAVVLTSVEAVQSEASASDVSLRVEVGADERLMIDGHAALLERLVTNLLVNAVRHNVHGGRAVVSLHRHDGPDQRGTVTATVSNTGEVIDPSTARALTEPFFRGSGRVASTTRPRGHGLGLTLAANIAEAHGSRLEVVANPDGGLSVSATFSTVPAEPVPEIAATEGACAVPDARSHLSS